MLAKKVMDAEYEARRFLARIDELKLTKPALTQDKCYWSSKHTGAVRRASMDLTRALAQLRKY